MGGQNFCNLSRGREGDVRIPASGAVGRQDITRVQGEFLRRISKCSYLMQYNLYLGNSTVFLRDFFFDRYLSIV